jgi:hypothetical protein
MGQLALDEYCGYVVQRDGTAQMVSAGIATPCKIPGCRAAGFYSLDMELIAESVEGQIMPAFKRDQPVRTKNGAVRGTFIEFRDGFGICRLTSGKFKAFQPSELLADGVTRSAVVPRAISKAPVSRVAERLASAKKIRAEAIVKLLLS